MIYSSPHLLIHLIYLPVLSYLPFLPPSLSFGHPIFLTLVSIHLLPFQFSFSLSLSCFPSAFHLIDSFRLFSSPFLFSPQCPLFSPFSIIVLIILPCPPMLPCQVSHLSADLLQIPTHSSISELFSCFLHFPVRPSIHPSAKSCHSSLCHKIYTKQTDYLHS